MLVTKKRYVGYSFESPEQRSPFFDAKVGIYRALHRDNMPDAVSERVSACNLVFVVLHRISSGWIIALGS